METVHKLEQTVADWYKKAPHLPPEVSKWIATNAWWLVIIWLVIGVFGVLAAIGLTSLGAMFLAGFGGIVGAALGGLALIAVLIGLALAIVQLVIASMAIQPLKGMRKRGWDLLFVIMLIDVVALAATLLLTFDIFSAVWGLLWVVVVGYFLFEARQYYSVTLATKKKSATKEVAK